MTALRELAVLNPSSEMGGAEISMIEMVKLLRGSPRVTLILPSAGPLEIAARNVGARVIIVPVPDRFSGTGEASKKRAWIGGLLALPSLFVFVRRLAATLKRGKFDLLLTNGIKSHVAGTLAAEMAGVPVAWHLRDSLEERPVSRRVLATLAGRSAGAIAISRYVKSQLSHRRLERLGAAVVYNPVDVERFRPDAVPPVDLQKPADEIWFAAIGALTELKGQDLFLRAADMVAADTPHARFFLVGTNTYDSERGSAFPARLNEMASAGYLRGRVRFLGKRDDIEHVIASMDVIVHSNRGPEALGRVVLEGMASGKPVLAFDHGGPAELLADGVTGLLVPRMDVEGLASAMRRLAADPDLRRALGARASAWIRSNLRSESIGADFRAALTGIVARKSAR